MRILCVGGGSGGHVTPVVAIVAAIRRLSPDSQLRFVTDKRFYQAARQSFGALGVPVDKVSAGKLRRYANLSLTDHLRHIFRSYLPNLVDFCRIVRGAYQAWRLVRRWRPDVVFIKGGYVGLPVGLVVARCFPRIPIVLHDSDAHPGLTNRLLSKYAARIAVGMPLEYSEYDPAKTEFVGVPIEEGFFEKSARQAKPPLVLVMGGSQGSQGLNQQIVDLAPQFADVEFLLVSGESHYSLVQEIAKSISNLTVFAFLPEAEVCRQMKRATVVISRAGATTMAEIAAARQPAIIVPSPYLAADHQTKNAEILAARSAAFVVREADLATGELAAKLRQLLADPKLRSKFSKNIAKFAKPQAAQRMAEIIIEVGNAQAQK